MSKYSASVDIGSCFCLSFGEAAFADVGPCLLSLGVEGGGGPPPPPPPDKSMGLDNSLSLGKMTVLLRAAMMGRVSLGRAARRWRAGKMYGSGERAECIIAQKRVEESIWGMGGEVEVEKEVDGVEDLMVGAVGLGELVEEEEEGGLDGEPLSCSVGAESAFSAFKLVGSPN